jgi:lysophospholipase L1-like esterase
MDSASFRRISAFKRLLAFGPSLVSVVAVLAACGADKKDNVPGNASTPYGVETGVRNQQPGGSGGSANGEAAGQATGVSGESGAGETGTGGTGTGETGTETQSGQTGSGGAGSEVGTGGSDAVGTGAGGASAAGSGTSLGLDTLRIVAVGDSITQSTCWRAQLWQRLTQDFAGRFDLVGSHQSDSGCAPSGYDQDNEGYGSALVTEVAAGVTNLRTCNPACPTLNDLRTRFAATPADVALLHFGTNDVWNGIATESIIAGYSQVLTALREANAKVTVLVAQIIPMNVTETTCAGCTCAGCVTGVPALNSRIVSWAAEMSTAESPVRVVDQYDGYDATTDNRDGVHPTPTTGSEKMATRWYEALAPLF